MPDDLKRRQAVAALDWLARVYAPVFLRLAQVAESAEKLERLPEITTIDARAVIADLKERRKDLSDRVLGHGLPHPDPAWEIIKGTFSHATSQMIDAAAEIWTVADGAAKIAIDKIGVPEKTVHETAGKLAQQLTDRLTSVS